MAVSAVLFAYMVIELIPAGAGQLMDNLGGVQGIRANGIQYDNSYTYFVNNRNETGQRVVTQVISEDSGTNPFSDTVASASSSAVSRTHVSHRSHSCNPHAKQLLVSSKKFRAMVTGKYGSCTSRIIYHEGHMTGRNGYHNIILQDSANLVVGNGSLYTYFSIQSPRVPRFVRGVLSIQGQQIVNDVVGSLDICLDFDVACVVHEYQNSQSILVGVEILCMYNQQDGYEQCDSHLAERPFLVVHYFDRSEIEQGCKEVSNLPEVSCLS